MISPFVDPAVEGERKKVAVLGPTARNIESKKERKEGKYLLICELQSHVFFMFRLALSLFGRNDGGSVGEDETVR
jgi:hypothetical protein